MAVLDHDEQEKVDELRAFWKANPLCEGEPA